MKQSPQHHELWSNRRRPVEQQWNRGHHNFRSQQRCWGSKIDFLSCFWNDEASLEPTDGVTHGMVVPAVVSEDGSVTGPVLLTVVLGFVLLRWFTSKGEVSDQM